MAKPYVLGPPSQKSDRCADPSYVKTQSSGPLPKILVVPGYQQNKGPMMDEPIPLPPVQKVAPPFRLR